MLVSAAGPRASPGPGECASCCARWVPPSRRRIIVGGHRPVAFRQFHSKGLVPCFESRSDLVVAPAGDCAGVVKRCGSRRVRLLRRPNAARPRCGEDAEWGRRRLLRPASQPASPSAVGSDRAHLRADVDSLVGFAPPNGGVAAATDTAARGKRRAGTNGAGAGRRAGGGGPIAPSRMGAHSFGRAVLPNPRPAFRPQPT